MSIVNKIKAIFSKDEIEKLKQDFNEAATEPVTLNKATLADGTEISYSGEIAVGTPIMMVAQDGTESPAPDGEHTLSDGRVIKVMGGAIAEVEAPQTEEVMTKEQVVAAIQNATTEVENKFKALETKFGKQTEVLNTVIGLISQLAELDESAPDPKTDPKQKAAFNKTEKFKSVADTIAAITNKK